MDRSSLCVNSLRNFANALTSTCLTLSRVIPTTFPACSRVKLSNVVCGTDGNLIFIKKVFKWLQKYSITSIHLFDFII